MTRTIVFTGLLTAATGLGALGAVAQNAAAPQGAQTQMQAPADTPQRQQDRDRIQWMSVADLAARLEQQGYTLEEIERDDGLYEVKMTDANGMRVEAYLDPATAEPIRDRDRLRERDGDGQRDDD